MQIAHWLHHLSLHFPIVGTWALMALGLVTWREESPGVIAFIRWSGWVIFTLTSVAAIAGIVAAYSSGEAAELRDHRHLGITAWCVIAVAAWGYDIGCRREDAAWRRFGVTIWGVAAIAALGAGHWGGLNEHADIIPF